MDLDARRGRRGAMPAPAAAARLRAGRLIAQAADIVSACERQCDYSARLVHEARLLRARPPLKR